MPHYFLWFRAELENLTNLQPPGGCDDPDYIYQFKLKCENCGEVAEKHSGVLLNETFPNPTGRDICHLVQKCKFCQRSGTVKMVPGHGKPLTVEMSQTQLASKLMLFECRGFEPVEFIFLNLLKAESVWGTEFVINPEEDDFAEYCEKGQEPVGMSSLKGYFKVTKMP